MTLTDIAGELQPRLTAIWANYDSDDDDPEVQVEYTALINRARLLLLHHGFGLHDIVDVPLVGAPHIVPEFVYDVSGL